MATRCRGQLTLSTRRHVSAISCRGEVVLKTLARKKENVERRKQRERKETRNENEKRKKISILGLKK
jgi:hypothetical protein